MPSFVDSFAAAIFTYWAHSAVACCIALVLARSVRRPQDRDLIWKTTLVAPILTAIAMLAGNFSGRGTIVDLADLLRRGWMFRLPYRRMTILVTNHGRGEHVVRQFTDPVTRGLTTTALFIATTTVTIALVRFAARRLALARALQSRQRVGDVAASNGATLRLSTADSLQSPVALGAIEICLPTEVLTDFGTAHTQSLIAHETAHLERRDPAWFLAAELLTALSAFQPLIFVVAGAFRRDVELICDEAALRRTGDRRALIGALARLAASFDDSSRLFAATAYDGSPLVQRAQRIATLSAAAMQHTGRRRGMLVVATLVAALLALPVFSSAPRLDDFRRDIPGIVRDAHLSGRTVTVDSSDAGAERIVRRKIVHVH